MWPQVLVFSESLVPTVRKALCDPLEEVREAAAKTFEQLHSTIGHQALDDILPALLKQLVRGGPAHNKRDSVCSPMCTDVCLQMYVSCFQDDEATAGFALDGLKQVMAVKSRSVLPYLVPKVRDGLLRSPA